MITNQLSWLVGTDSPPLPFSSMTIRLRTSYLSDDFSPSKRPLKWKLCVILSFKSVMTRNATRVICDHAVGLLVTPIILIKAESTMDHAISASSSVKRRIEDPNAPTFQSQVVRMSPPDYRIIVSH